MSSTRRHRRSRRGPRQTLLGAGIVVLGALAILAGGLFRESRPDPGLPTGSEQYEAPNPSATPVAGGHSENTVARSSDGATNETIVATATKAEVSVHSQPGRGSRRVLSNPTESGAPLIFVVMIEEHDWLRVHLPIRPNGTTGWVRRSDVSLTRHDYRIVVELSAHRITVFKGSTRVFKEPVGVGTRDTPTPHGFYYLTELLQPPDPDGPYGPFAYGLSGFSEVLKDFAGGRGVIGIHGTNDPSTIGKDVSHGCIRMSNQGITRLARILPLGTPVEIRP
jgi:lipoprotein-anchoring transpeptidase ErfK/SrfK